MNEKANAPLMYPLSDSILNKYGPIIFKRQVVRWIADAAVRCLETEIAIRHPRVEVKKVIIDPVLIANAYTYENGKYLFIPDLGIRLPEGEILLTFNQLSDYLQCLVVSAAEGMKEILRESYDMGAIRKEVEGEISELKGKQWKFIVESKNPRSTQIMAVVLPAILPIEKIN